MDVGLGPQAIVVGAGPAGLMAAERLAECGADVTVIERMPSPARKLLMAGRGGLNLTHSEQLAAFLDRYGPRRGVLEPKLARFPPDDLIAWANDLGAETFVGSSGRVFPKAMKASPLVRAWLRRLDGAGVQIVTRARWTGWDDDGHLMVSMADGTTDTRAADIVVLALGGASWPRLGSDGSWATTLAAAGVEIAPLVPANCGVHIAWSEYLRDRCAGMALKRVIVRVGDHAARGEAVITRYGLEGGVIYALGAAIRAGLEHGPAKLAIDLKPDVSHDALVERLQLLRRKDSLANALRKSVRLDVAGIALIREAGALDADATALAARIKAVELTATGLAGLDRAISTAGGIAFDAVDARLMLKNRPGVFVAGEMLDWEAPTGGYLLQACFATGRAAAEGAMEWFAENAYSSAL